MILLRAMSGLVHYHVVDRVAVVTVDNPPVNALSPGWTTHPPSAVGRPGDPHERAIAGRTPLVA